MTTIQCSVARAGVVLRAAAQIPSNESLGQHQLAMESGGKRSNALAVTIVSIAAEPVAPSRPGIVQTITVHVNGLAPGDQAEMFFEVGGAAAMIDGGNTATVQVIGNVARVQVRGTSVGHALLKYRLHVKSADFI